MLALLAAVAAGVAAIVLRRRGPSGRGEPPGPGPGPVSRFEGNVAVGLVARDGRPAPARSVVLVSGRARVELRRRHDDFVGRVEPGRYRVVAEVEAPLRLPPIEIAVRAEPARWALHVVAPEEPYLRIGSEILPIEARTDLLVVASASPVDAESATRLVDRARELGLVLVDPATAEPIERPTSSSFLVLRADEGRGWFDRDQVARLEELARAAGFDPATLRVGFVADAGERGTPLLDRRHLVRLADGGQRAAGAQDIPDEVRRRFDQLDADVLRALPEPDTYLIEFRDPDFRRHLRLLESYVAEGVFRYAEPSLATPATDLVDLAAYLALYQAAPQPASVPLERMAAPAGWADLVNSGSANAPGALATVDRGVLSASSFVSGVDLELRDWQGNVTAGHVIDLALPTPHHGMQVFGPASGNGHLGVWGVAPNLRHVAVQRSDAAGSDVFWDAFDELLAAGVRAVSLSFKPNFTGWDSHSEFRIQALVGAGMLLVVAAGNDRARLANADGSTSARGDATSNGVTVKWVHFPLAAHDRTFTVASTQLGGDGEEQFWDQGGGVGTNRGDAVDLCALATGYVTCADGVAAAPASGTSLAAPLVAATAAAVWARKPGASVAQVKAVLCASARRIRAGEPHWSAVGAPADWDGSVAVPLHHLRYGFGQLDVAAALARAATLP